MTKWLSILILILGQTTVLAQGKYNANWCFGVKAGIDFGDTSRPVNFGSSSNNLIATASFSDPLGNLLFYIAPDTPFAMQNATNKNSAIYGGNHLIVDNGNNLMTGSDLTGALFIPIDESHTFLFYFKRIDSSTGFWTNLYCSKIERGISGYSVVEKNRVVCSYPTESRISAVKHSNGEDWWLLIHASCKGVPSLTTNRFYMFMIHGGAINAPLVQDVGKLHHTRLVGGGQMAFSKDGKYLAMPLNDQNEADVFRFDRCSGLLSVYSSLTSVDDLGTGELVSAAFSPDGSRLYISAGYGDFNGSTNAVFQYSLDTSNVNSTRNVIYPDTNQSKFIFGDIRLAPDNRIYLAVTEPSVPFGPNDYSAFNQYLWTIGKPNLAGSHCDFQRFSYLLGDSSRTYGGLPNMPNYNLGPISVYAAGAGKDTLWCKDTTAGVTIGSPTVQNIVYQWQPTAGLSNPSIAQPTASPDSSTYYVLTVTDTSQGSNSCASRTDTVFVRVEVCMGVSEAELPIVKVYPNPANNLLFVETSATPKSTFVLYDLVGHPVVETPLRDVKTPIDISFLSNGFYFYRVGAVSGKVQVVR